jgi:hypothetical protein
MIRLAFSLLILFFAVVANAQICPIYKYKLLTPRKIIVQTNTHIDKFEVPQGYQILKVDKLVPKLNIYLIELNKTISQADFLSSNQSVISFSYDKPLKQRSLNPNDSLFSRQDFLKKEFIYMNQTAYGINAIEAWNYNIVPVNFRGDSMVCALIDFYFDSSLLDVRYITNKNEIPFNNLDDDNNGYVDDYQGYNATLNSGKINSIPYETHGNATASVLGAIANNVTFGVGVAPNASILPVVINGHVSDLLKGYQYVYDMRRIYDSTNGAQGLYIVTLNVSLGTSGKEQDQPIWCAMHDLLGEIGIITVASAENNYFDIDKMGSLPESCSSPYLITVGGATPFRNFDRTSAYGKETVDVLTYGSRVQASDGRFFYTHSGNSFGAPQVAGLISLMYSNLTRLPIESMKSRDLALKLKDIILQNGYFKPSLLDTCKTGRIIEFNSILKATKEFTDSYAHLITPEIEKQSLEIDFDESQIRFMGIKSTVEVRIFDLMGRNIYQDKISIAKPFIDIQRRGTLLIEVDMGNESFRKKIHR